MDSAALALHMELDQLRREIAVAERARDLALEAYNDERQRLARVRALADLAGWASEQESADEPRVLVSDLRRALQ